MSNIKIGQNQIKDLNIVTGLLANLAVTNGKLAGSIANNKLLQITAADKVAGSAVQLASTSALEDSTGLRLKSAVAGAALAISDQVLSVAVDDSSIEVSSDAIRVKASGITNTMLAGSIANAKLSNSTISGVALGSDLSALSVDDSSIEYSSGSAFNGSAASTIRVKAAGITNAMLAGSIASTKVAELDNFDTDALSEGSSNQYFTDARVQANRLDQMAQPTAAVAMNSQKITGMADPTSAQDAATKAYVDATKQGLSAKDSVRVATTANITLSGTQTIDGVSVVADDRVLVKNQSSAEENGIYVCAAGAWSRAADMDAQAEFEAGAYFFVEEGTANGDAGFVLTTDGAITVDTTELAFTQFSGAGQIVAGAAMSKTGNQLDVEVDDSSIEVSSDALQVKASGITNAMLAGSIEASKLELDLGLQSSTIDGVDKLEVKLKDAGGLSATPSDGLFVQASGITNDMLAGSIANAKLANSTISGKALGANLDSLTDGNGISDFTYNGSGTASISIDLDGSTLAVGGSGLKIADAGVDTAQLAAAAVETAKIAAAAVETAKIADDAVTIAKVGWKIYRDYDDGDGSAVNFDLDRALDSGHVEVLVYRNGLLCENDPSPSTVDTYSVDATGGSGGVGRVTFGAAPAATDRLNFVYIAD